MSRPFGIGKTAGALALAALALQVRGQDIDAVIDDMRRASEALPIAPEYAWQRAPQIVQYTPRGAMLPAWWRGARPEWCHAALSWYTAFEAEGNAAGNTRVQVRNLRLYTLSDDSRKWRLADLAHIPHSDRWEYPFRIAGNGTRPDVRDEAGGGHSVRPQYPYFLHGYGRTVLLENPGDVRAVFVALEFRLVLEDPAKPDDRSRARYVVNAGADYYPGLGRDWGMAYAPGIGSGRYLLATADWRVATLLVPNTALGASFEELRRNHPPLGPALDDQ